MSRTRLQVTFDLTKRGWSFCSLPRLLTKQAYLADIAKDLPTDDPRHKLMPMIERRVKELRGR